MYIYTVLDSQPAIPICKGAMSPFAWIFKRTFSVFHCSQEEKQGARKKWEPMHRMMPFNKPVVHAQALKTTSENWIPWIASEKIY